MSRLYPSTSMEEIELSPKSPPQGDDEKRNPECKRAPAVLVFTRRKALWATFALIYVVTFLRCLVGAVVLSMNPYVMSHFSMHSMASDLTMTVGIVSGVFILHIAKVMDEFGRAPGFFMAAVLPILGLIIQAAAQSWVASFVGQALFGIGCSFLDYVLSIVLADMTSLKNRALIYGIYLTPIIITSVAAPAIAEQVHSQFAWRVAFGVSAGILSIALPLLGVVLFRAQSNPWETDEASDNTKLEKNPYRWGRLRRFLVELDVPGSILAFAGLLLVMFPLNNPPGAEDSWASFITMTVLGTCCLIGFLVWENDLARTTCVPWSLLRNRTVLGGCLVGLFSVASAASWGSYYNSYLQVVYDQTAAFAGYVTRHNLFSYAVFAPFIGLMIRFSGNYKFPAFFAAPILAVFTGLLLVFHGPGARVIALGGIQAMIGFSMRFFIGCSQMAVMADIEHKDVALAVGVWSTFLSIAAAIGSGISRSLWTRTVPGALLDYLPADSGNITADVIIDSLENEKTFPAEGLIRNAVLKAVWTAQEEMIIMGICFSLMAFACIFLWRNIDVRKRDNGEKVAFRNVIW